jgi:acyl-CoA synthetase (AMP-forming)/AMP-acid ligase II
LIDVLNFYTGAHPDRPHLQIWLSEDCEHLITYADLHNRARKVAFGLTKRGLVPGERVAIMLATETAFFEAFFGTLYAGGIPVPVYPPFRRSQVEDHLRRQAGILKNAEAGFREFEWRN